MLAIDKIMRWEDVRRLDADWNSLAANASGHLFLSFRWIMNWSEHLGRDVAPYFLRVREGGRTVAIVPLVLTRVRWRRLPARQLAFCVNSQSPWGGVVIPSGEEEIAPAVWRFLKDQDDWDIVRLDMIPRGQMGDIFQSQAPAQGLQSMTAEISQYYLPVDGTWESYLATRTKRFRKRLNGSAKHLGEQGSLSTRVYDTPASIQEGVRMFFEVDSRSWKRSDGEAIMDHGRLRDYYIGATAAFAAVGGCYVVVMTLDEKPISAALFFSEGTGAYGVKTSFVDDPAYSEFSPGFLAVASGVRECWRRGIREFYFLSAASDWERWTDSRVNFVSRIAFHPSRYGRLLAGMEKLGRAIRRTRDRFTFVGA